MLSQILKWVLRIDQSKKLKLLRFLFLKGDAYEKYDAAKIFNEGKR